MGVLRRNPNLSLYVTNVVYGPAAAAYGLILVDYELLALTLYLLFMTVAAFRLSFFRKLGDWPMLSRIALFAGPVLVASGFFTPIDLFRYWVLVPAILYMCISIAGGVALRRAKLEF